MTASLNLPLVSLFCVSNLTMTTSLKIIVLYFLESDMVLFFLFLFCFCFGNIHYACLICFYSARIEFIFYYFGSTLSLLWSHYNHQIKMSLLPLATYLKTGLFVNSIVLPQPNNAFPDLPDCLP